MSTKPGTLPEWNTINTNRVAPSVARKAVGWLLGERPAGGYFNWLSYWTFKWLEYLNDGALSGNHSITGDLAVTGTITGGFATFKRPIAAGLGYLYGGAATLGGNYWSGGAAGTVHLPLVGLREGDRIKKVRVRHRRGGGSPSYALRRFTYATLEAAIATKTIAAGAADAEDTIDNGSGGDINHTIAAGYDYVIEATIGNGADRFYSVTVEADHPAP